MASTKHSSAAEIVLPRPVMVAVGVPMLAAVAHAVMTRTVDDFVRYPLYFAVPASIAVYVGLVYEWWKSMPRKASMDAVWIAIMIPIGLYVLSAGYYAIGASIKDAYFWLQALALSREQKIALTVGVTLGAGLVLFFFRKYFRSTYGLSEAIVGLVVAADHVKDHLDKGGTDSGLYLALLTAGVYLVVRGLDNVDQGRKTDPLALWLLARMGGSAASAPTLPAPAGADAPAPPTAAAVPAQQPHA